MVSPFGIIKEELAKELAAALKECGYDPKNLENTIDVSRNFGDISCSAAFRISKQKPGTPNDIAQNIVKKLKKSASIKKISIDNAYINFYLDRPKFTKETIE